MHPPMEPNYKQGTLFGKFESVTFDSRLGGVSKPLSLLLFWLKKPYFDIKAENMASSTPTNEINHYFFISKILFMAPQYFLRKALAEFDLSQIIMEDLLHPLHAFHDKYLSDKEDVDTYCSTAASSVQCELSDVEELNTHLRYKIEKLLASSPIASGQIDDYKTFIKEIEHDLKKEEFQRRSMIIHQKMIMDKHEPEKMLEWFLNKVLDDRKFYFRKDVVIRLPNLHWIVYDDIRRYIDDNFPENFTNQKRKTKAYKKDIISLIDEIVSSDHLPENPNEIKKMISSLEIETHGFLTKAEIYDILEVNAESIIKEFSLPDKRCHEIVVKANLTKYLAAIMNVHSFISDWFEDGFFSFYEKQYAKITSGSSFEDTLETSRNEWDKMYRDKFSRGETWIFKNLEKLKNSKHEQAVVLHAKIIALKDIKNSSFTNKDMDTLKSIQSDIILNDLLRGLQQLNDNLFAVELEEILRGKTAEIAKNYDPDENFSGYLYVILRNLIGPSYQNLDNLEGDSYNDSSPDDLPLELYLLESLDNIPKTHNEDELCYLRFGNRNYKCKECYKEYYDVKSKEFQNNCENCSVKTATSPKPESVLKPIKSFIRIPAIERIIKFNRSEVLTLHPGMNETLKKYMFYYNILFLPRARSKHCFLHHKVAFLYNIFKVPINTIWEVAGFDRNFEQYLDDWNYKNKAKTLNTILFEFTVRLIDLREGAAAADQDSYAELLDDFIQTKNKLRKLQKEEQPTQADLDEIREFVEELITIRSQIVVLLNLNDLREQLKEHEDLYWDIIDAFQLFIDGKSISYNQANHQLENLKLLEYEKFKL